MIARLEGVDRSVVVVREVVYHFPDWRASITDCRSGSCSVAAAISDGGRSTGAAVAITAFTKYSVALVKSSTLEMIDGMT